MKKEYRISVRLSPNERAALRIIARREALTLSETMRLLLREGMTHRDLFAAGLISMNLIEVRHDSK